MSNISSSDEEQTTTSNKMSIGYVKSERKVRIGDELQTKYVARVFMGRRVGRDALAAEICNMCTASEADVLLVLRALEDVVARHIADGHVVNMGEFGTVYPVIHATVVDRPEEVKVSTIQSVGVRFMPNRRFAQRVKEAGLRLVDSRVYRAKTHPRTKKEKEG